MDCPEQVRVIPVSDRHHAFSESGRSALGSGFRVRHDQRSEKVGYKNWQAQMEKVLEALVIGDKEMDEGVLPCVTFSR